MTCYKCGQPVMGDNLQCDDCRRLWLDDEEDDSEEDEIFGYECLECQNIQANPGRCNRCDSGSVDPMYF